MLAIVFQRCSSSTSFRSMYRALRIWVYPGRCWRSPSWCPLGTGLIFGIMPALQAARQNIVSNVKSGARTTDARGQRFHSCLVVAQVAVSVILLIGSGSAAQKLRNA